MQKKGIGQVLFLVSNGISITIVHVKEMLTPVLRIVFSKIGSLPITTERSINLEELPDFHRHFQLRAEVESVLKHMAKIKNKVIKPKFHSLNEWNLNPLGVH